jgi:hypothetical protein
MKPAPAWMIACFLAFASSQAALAETPTPTPAATAAAAALDAKKAKAKACSDLADAKKLHGQARKDFREKCKKS